MVKVSADAKVLLKAIDKCIKSTLDSFNTHSGIRQLQLNKAGAERNATGLYSEQYKCRKN